MQLRVKFAGESHHKWQINRYLRQTIIILFLTRFYVI